MSNDRFKTRLNAQIREEASEWLVCFCEGDLGASVRENFDVWLRTSPEHVRAYLRVSAFWEDVKLLDKHRTIDIDALVQRALDECNVVPLGVTADRPSPDAKLQALSEMPEVCPEVSPQLEMSGTTWTSARLRRVAIAAVLFIVIAAGVLFTWPPARNASTYTTDVGELRTVTLRDGSKVELNARSRIKVRFSESQRFVDLVEGQALFHVAKDATRPFIVRSGGASVKAVGTQFDVDRRSNRTVVTVLEGRVAISEPAWPRLGGARPQVEKPPVLLSAGGQAVVTPQAIVPSGNANLAAATAWTEGLLIFDATPLSEVVEQFNRHNLRPLIVEDAWLKDLRISGIFPATGADRITEFLRERFGVAVRETDDDIRISGT